MSIVSVAHAATTTAAAATTTTTAAAATADTFGTYLKPFAATSLWNSRPVSPVLGTYVIPKSSYYPAIAQGAYSSGVYKADYSSTSTDTVNMVVYPTAGRSGVWDQDAEAYVPTVTIPRWPAATTPSTSTDGHADIVDETTGIVHSFWYLRKDAATGQWRANSYSWADLKGRGWGDTAHYYQGARAVGVPPLAGLIRKHEVDDGKATYMHALSLSMTYNGLAAKPAYIYPATSADYDAATTNTGGIPEGALLMLPSTYDTSKIANPALKKVADTLKVYGAYVVDRNFGTPFNIYVENGSNFDLYKNGWDNAVAAELDRMRANLRQVVSVSGFLDGNGKAVAAPAATLTPATLTVAPAAFNLLSMRGNSWYTRTGPIYGVYSTTKQAIVYPATTEVKAQVIYNRRNIIPLNWSTIKVGDSFKLTAIATGGAKLQLHLRNYSGNNLTDSGMLGDGQSVRFCWPANVYTPYLFAYSGISTTGSTITGTLVNITGTAEAMTCPK